MKNTVYTVKLFTVNVPHYSGTRDASLMLSFCFSTIFLTVKTYCKCTVVYSVKNNIKKRSSV